MRGFVISVSQPIHGIRSKPQLPLHGGRGQRAGRCQFKRTPQKPFNK
jgi:hypothetical protein